MLDRRTAVLALMIVCVSGLAIAQEEESAAVQLGCTTVLDAIGGEAGRGSTGAEWSPARRA